MLHREVLSKFIVRGGPRILDIKLIFGRLKETLKLHLFNKKSNTPFLIFCNEMISKLLLFMFRCTLVHDCGRRRLAVIRYWMICLVNDNLIYFQMSP